MKFLSLILMFAFSSIHAQQIVNYVFVGDKGITTDVDEAHSFIIVKKYNDRFQRLDYKINAPLIKERNFSDSSLSILEGNYNFYNADGAQIETGNYKNNLKDGAWYHFDNENKIILEEEYKDGVIITTKTDFSKKSDTLKEESFKDNQEAMFGKGNFEFVKYLKKNINGNVGRDLTKGGIVLVGFTIDTTGKCFNIFLKKSVEYKVDEEARRVIEKCPNWKPAFQNGKLLNAYRLQPISFMK